MLGKLRESLKKLIIGKGDGEIARGGVYSFLAKVLSYGISFFIGLFSARYYGASLMGELAIITNVIAIAALFSVFGFSTLLLKLIPSFIHDYSKASVKPLYLRSLTIILFISAIVATILLLFGDFIADGIFHKENLSKYIYWSALFVFLSSINTINISVIRALKMSKSYALFEVLPKIVTFLLLFLFTWFITSNNNLIYILFSTTTIITMASLLYIASVFKKNQDIVKVKLPSRRLLLNQAMPMMVIGGLHLIMAQTDTLMLGVFRTSEELGVYNIAFSLSLFTSFVLNSVNVISAPKFSELFHAKKMEELKLTAKKSSQLILIGTTPIILGLIFLGNWILSFYGEEFIEGYWALLFLVFGQLISSIAGSVGYFLNMTGHQKQLQRILIIAAIVNIVLNYFLIPIYGIYGAAFATMLSTVLWNIIATVYIKVKFGFFITSIGFNKKRNN